MDDSVVQEFINITQCEESMAKQYLEFVQGDLERAIEQFYEHPRKFSALKNMNQPAEKVVQQEEENIREPMLPLRTRLLDEHDSSTSFAPVTSKRSKRSPSNQSADSRSIFEAFRDFKSEIAYLDSVKGQQKNKASSLAELFRPPLEYLFMGSIEQAKASAVQLDQYVIINIQDQTLFESQMLNRDTWSDQGIQTLLRHFFVLVQIYQGTTQAIDYSKFYRVIKYPHIGILDGRTGERFYCIEGFIPPDELSRQLLDFLESKNIDTSIAMINRGIDSRTQAKSDKSSNNRRKQDSHLDHHSIVQNYSTPTTSIETLTEEEQFAQAIMESLVEARHPSITTSNYKWSNALSLEYDRISDENDPSEEEISTSSGEDNIKFDHAPITSSDLVNGDKLIRDHVNFGHLPHYSTSTSYSYDDHIQPVESLFSQVQAKTEKRVSKSESLNVNHALDVHHCEDEPLTETGQRVGDIGEKQQEILQREKEVGDLDGDIFQDKRELNCTLQIRFPDGNVVVQKFNSATTLLEVHQLIHQKYRSKHQGRFFLATNFPRHVFAKDELCNTTLEQARMLRN